MEISTPRPSLDVKNLSSPHKLHKHRRKAIKHAIPRSKDEKKVVSKVVSRIRRQQRRLRGDSESDPDPYASDYVFFCLEGARET